MSTTFAEKSDLLTYLITNDNDQKDFIEQSWDYLLEKDLSFVVTDRDGDIVGISLNIDGQDPPEVTTSAELGVIIEFLDSVEKPVLSV